MSLKTFLSFTAITCFLLFFSAISASSARILLDMANPPSTFGPRTHPSLTFLIRDVLLINNATQSSTVAPLPTPLPAYTPVFTANSDNPSYSTQTLDIPGLEISIRATSTLQEELQFGHTTVIESNMYVENVAYGPQLVGKAKGIYVATKSDDVNGGRMMAMTASFISTSTNNGNYMTDYSSSLRLFGVQRKDVSECHVAVIGGTGKFHGANGYATINAVNRRNNDLFVDVEQSSEEVMQLLLYNVYLS
ncbi:hypothetical protein vseg_008654 [Gypsophila vaccaria]